jgi:hypothetical protein
MTAVKLMPSSLEAVALNVCGSALAQGIRRAMKIILPDLEKSNLRELLNQIDDWLFVIAPWGENISDDYIVHDHWLGSSRDGRIWALAAKSNAANGETREHDLHITGIGEQVVALLLDPPKRDSSTISKILFSIHYRNVTGDPHDAEAINRITRQISFPEHLKVRAYLPEAPKEWLDLPAELVVGFAPSEGASISKGTFEEFTRSSLKTAIGVVCGLRHEGILIGYNLVIREVMPFLKWEVDWPLARRGKGMPYERQKVQGMLPWEYKTDDTLVSIYQSVPFSGAALAPHYYNEPVVRLRVGGRNRGEAISNWLKCAKALRKLKQQVKNDFDAAPCSEEH